MATSRLLLFVLFLLVLIPTSHAEVNNAPLVGAQPVATSNSSFYGSNESVVQLSGDQDSFPDVVLVGGNDSFYCTGILIDAQHVLTAGHCGAATRVAFGNGVPNATPASVTGTTTHPRLDVALLRLAHPARVRLHSRRTQHDTTPPAGAVRIVGFGVRDRLRLTGFGVKRMSDVEVDGWACTVARAASTGCLTNDELLIRGGTGNDTCLGDSGGPVFELLDQEWRLVALTSRGMRPRKVICGEGGIYTRLDRIDTWIQKETSK